MSDGIWEASLSTYIEQVREAWRTVGVAVAVVRGEELIYGRGFGRRRRDDAAEVDVDTLFQVGSTTKAFTASAIGMLVDEGMLAWDDRIVDHLPELKLKDPWLTRHLTVRDVLTHRAGLSIALLPYLAVIDSNSALDQLRYADANGRFRDCFEYDNLLYALAGKLVEAVSSCSWSNFTRMRLLEPLNMTRTRTSPYDIWARDRIIPTFLGCPLGEPPPLSEARIANVAMPHFAESEGCATLLSWGSYDNEAPAGSMVSSAADMAKWLSLNLRKGRVGTQQLIDTRTIQELHRVQNPHGKLEECFFGETSDGYTLGWWRARYRQRVHLEHGGGMIGFPAYVCLVPEEDLGIVVLSNTGLGPGRMLSRRYLFHKAVAYWIIDRLLGDQVHDWSSALIAHAREADQAAHCEEIELSRDRNPKPASCLPFSAYTGHFGDMSGSTGRIAIDLEAGSLGLSFAGEGAFHARLVPWQGNTHRLQMAPPVANILGPQFATFQVEDGGQVNELAVFGSRYRRL
ncbi:serine hydrolase domain-containing protein [Sphingosinicella rhizophila]|uniref:Serine hydrolase domain-containing protein n=1 Tax=Sphingosinicella rhizophila TaxID=3050082 RepID=A0ABU3Q4K4_9SPHN|nr:serine hydrolase domain-containing protein [Sphingosinicella sp. GR2756]MDT9598351.1 serine hydrolase domain-containing protein [Sphingosinicella sp. GR2756]